MRSEVEAGIHLPPLVAVVLLRLTQLATRCVSVKRKEIKGKRNFCRWGKESDKSEKMEENQRFSRRFKILNQGNQFTWDLSDDTTIYDNSHFNQYIQWQNLYESILTKNPILSKNGQVKKLDIVMLYFLPLLQMMRLLLPLKIW